MDAGTNRNAPARRSFLAFLLLLCALALACAAHAREASAPEGVAKAFYAWYIGKDAAGVYPLLDQGIGDYVAAATVDGLRAAYRRNELPGDADYFLKVQDYDEADWGAHIETHPAVLLGDVALVPVSFGSVQRVSVVVFLRKDGTRWKIVKVDDTRGYP